MKRIAGFLTAICMLFSVYATSFAAIKIDSVTPDSLPAGLSASEFDDEEDKVFHYKERNNYVKVNLPEVLEGKIYSSFKIKIKNKDYVDFRVQMVGSEGELRTVQFIPQDDENSNRTTKVDPKPTGIDDGILDYDALPENEWVTVKLTLDTEAESFDSSLTYSNGETKVVHTGASLKTRDAYDLKQIMFAFNRISGSPIYTGAYFKDFHIYQMAEIVSVETVTDEVEVGADYTFPEKVKAVLDNGSETELPITWSAHEADTSTVQELEFTGTVEGYDGEVKLILSVKPLSITNCETIDVYLERTEDSMPERIRVQYSNGKYGYEHVTWHDIDRTAQVVQTVTGNISGYSEPVEANVYLYDANEPLFVEDCEAYDNGEQIGGKYLSPLPREDQDDYWGWAFNVPGNVIAKPNPLDGDSMSIALPVTDSYSEIDIGKSRSGQAIISYDLFFADNAGDFRTILCPESEEALIELSFNAVNGTITRQGSSSIVWNNVIEPGEWVNVKYITDTYTDTYDIFVNNIKVADDIEFKTLNKGNIFIIKFANKSAEECEVYLDNVKIYALSDMLESSYNELAIDNTNVTGNLTLRTPKDSTVSAKWESGDTTVIANDGTVTLPEWQSGDKEVKLTLTLEKDIGASYIVSGKYDFDMTVKEAPPTDCAAVENAFDTLTFDTVKNTNTAENDIKDDLLLPLNGDFGVNISWSSDNEAVIDDTGRIYMPDADTTVKLTAVLSRGTYSKEKVFELVVKHSSELSDLQAVRLAVNELKIPSSTSSNLNLPTTAGNGVSVSWVSGNLNALSNSGVYKKPSKTVTVTMTAVLTKGEARQEKEFEVKVYAGTSSSGGGGGGSAGGTVASPNIIPVQDTTPAVDNTVQKPLYSDLEEYAWAQEAIYALTDAKVLMGVGNAGFEPGRNVSREEFVAMTVRAFGIKNSNTEIKFKDVLPENWYYGVCQSAFGFGIINGISEDMFGSGIEIKRQDMAAILYKAAIKSGVSFEKIRENVAFSDRNDISDYAEKAINTLYEAGVINGYDEIFAPKRSAKRAEAAKMLYEIYKLINN